MSNETDPRGTSTPRTRVRRLPELARTDRQSINELLERSIVGHVAVVDDQQPYAIPVAYGLVGDQILVHGSTGSRLFRLLAEGAPACFTVTVVDALVLARSAFESSMNYRSVMVLGQFLQVPDSEKMTTLEGLTERLCPGRWQEARKPSRRELAATLVLAMPLDECSMKVSTGDPTDAPEDLTWPVWAGVVPIQRRWGLPIPAANLADGYEPPRFLDTWPPDRA